MSAVILIFNYFTVKEIVLSEECHYVLELVLLLLV